MTATASGGASGWRLEAGAELGSWRIVRPIGAGGMGEVYEAQHSWLPTRKAAVKVVRQQRISVSAYGERFRAEAALLATIDHPNVVRLYDAGVTETDLAWMAMELLAGQPLDEILAVRRRLEPTEAALILAEIADGLHAAHLIGVVHRDLKPGNVFLTDDHKIKVLDFGTSKLLEAAHDLRRIKPTTAQNVVIGTFSFMSPEQLLGKPPLDLRSDIFALGILAYLILSARHPFATDEPAAPEVMAYRALMMDPVPIGEVVPGVPADLAALVHAMLEKNRENRPRTMANVAERLRAARSRLLLAKDRPPASIDDSVLEVGRLLASAPESDVSLRRRAGVDAIATTAPARALSPPAAEVAPTESTSPAPARATPLRLLDATQPIETLDEEACKADPPRNQDQQLAGQPLADPTPAIPVKQVAASVPLQPTDSAGPAAGPKPPGPRAPAPELNTPRAPEHRAEPAPAVRAAAQRDASAPRLAAAAGSQPALLDPTLRAREEALARRRQATLERQGAEGGRSERLPLGRRLSWWRVVLRAKWRMHHRVILAILVVVFLIVGLAIGLALWAERGSSGVRSPKGDGAIIAARSSAQPLCSTWTQS